MAHGEFQPWLKYKPPCFLGNNLTAHAHVVFSAQAEIPFRQHRHFVNFSSRLPKLKIPAWFLKLG